MSIIYLNVVVNVKFLSNHWNTAQFIQIECFFKYYSYYNNDKKAETKHANKFTYALTGLTLSPYIYR